MGSVQQLALLPGMPEWVVLPTDGLLCAEAEYEDYGDEDDKVKLERLEDMFEYRGLLHFTVSMRRDHDRPWWIIYHGDPLRTPLNRDGHIQAHFEAPWVIAQLGEDLARGFALPPSAIAAFPGIDVSIARDALTVRAIGDEGRAFATIREAITEAPAGLVIGGEDLEHGVGIHLHIDAEGRPQRFKVRICPAKVAARYQARVRDRVASSTRSAARKLEEAREALAAMEAIAADLAAHDQGAPPGAP